ncbi:hypothetical protein NEPTK9_001562 [Candidatus Neptunochlamydia vexilliferae]|uniref:Uncharacterized protein n=1 Tax=Candidatus Neptunichlamydia vexilliferae TaxID=1651774 RepID=A0ABS0B2S4_9BACT|nr:hypothetical protein [Candidatus Neptunochlamydia vexilliferae]
MGLSWGSSRRDSFQRGKLGVFSFTGTKGTRLVDGTAAKAEKQHSNKKAEVIANFIFLMVKLRF